LFTLFSSLTGPSHIVISSSSPLAGPEAIEDATKGGLGGASSASPAISSAGAGVEPEDTAGVAAAGCPKEKEDADDELANADGLGAVEVKEKPLLTGLGRSVGVPKETLLAAGAPKLKAGLGAFSAVVVEATSLPKSNELDFWPKENAGDGVAVRVSPLDVCVDCSLLEGLARSAASI
jgi:hypothetical protein